MENTTYLLDEFVNTRVGLPFRLFPFGKIVKNGKTHTITPESAASFRLPHFKPAIKLGSHDEPTPAGGHIVGLEVRADGLYALPEWNDKGETAIQDGAYRYHSPEVLWGGALEDPNTGELIEGPLIVGDALLHMPHLGEAAKLYSVEPISKGVKTMTVENVEVPKAWYEGVMSFFKGEAKPEKPADPQPEPQPVTETDEFKAVAQQAETYKAELDAMKAEAEKKELLGSITAELQDAEKYGAVFAGAEAANEAAEMLSGLNAEQREWVQRNFKALIAQAKAGELFAEMGEDKPALTNDPVAAFDAEIKRLAAEKQIGYAEAVKEAAASKPELYQAYTEARNKKE